jgi:protease I
MGQARVACLLGQGFEDSEFRIPYDRLCGAGMAVDVIGATAGEELRGYRGKETVEADLGVADVKPQDYDALLIPGGYSPDHLRADERFVEFVRAFDATGRPIAAVCHGPQLLIAAGRVRGRTMTAWKTIQSDLLQVGALVKDAPVVVDGNWITSRQPSDLEDFSETLIRVLGEAESDEPAAPRGYSSASSSPPPSPDRSSAR